MRKKEDIYDKFFIFKEYIYIYIYIYIKGSLGREENINMKID